MVFDPGREILDGNDLIVGLEYQFREALQIKPLMGTPLERPIVEIEPIDIDSRPKKYGTYPSNRVEPGP